MKIGTVATAAQIARIFQHRFARIIKKSQCKSMLFIFVCFSFLLSYQLSAQKYLQLNPKLNEDIKIDCTDFTTLFIDSTASKTTQNIDNQAFNHLSRFKFDKFSLDYFKYNFWLKIPIENPTTDTIKVLLSTGIHKSVEVFMDGEILKTNQELLWDDRPYRYDESYVPLNFSPKRKYDLLIKIAEQPQLNFQLKPELLSYGWDAEDKIRAFYDEYFILVFDGFFISILVFVVLFTFIFYFIDPKRYYLFYGGYVGSLLIFSLWGIEHSPYMKAFHTYLPFLKFSGNNNIYVLFSNLFYGYFLQNFLELEQNAPRFLRSIKIFRNINFVLLFLDSLFNFVLQNHQFGGYIWLITQPIVIIWAIYTLIELYRLKQVVLKRYLQIGTTALIIGIISGFLEQLLFLKPTDTIIMRLSPSIPFIIGVLIEIFVFSLAIGFKTWVALHQKGKLLKSIQKSELRTLRSQINPHFVFNSLNSIKSFILTHRPQEAAEYLTDFSALMRSILQHSKEQLITLKDELETANLYVKLEKLRFEDGFDYVFEYDESIDNEEVMIPPMLLQPYIENAIKHGLMNKDGGRSLSLKVVLIDKIFISIEDNGVGRQEAAKTNKNSIKYKSMGMDINKERIRLLELTNDLKIEIKIIDKKSKEGKSEGTKVEICLPVEE